MIRIAIGYVAIVVLSAAVILLNPFDFMGREARQARGPAAAPLPEGATAPGAQDSAAQANALPVQDSVAAATAAVLADLRQASVPAPAPAAAPAAAAVPLAVAEPVATEEDAMSRMSAAVIAGLRGAAPVAAEEQTKTLEGLVAQALIDGETDAAIDALVNQAVAEGEIAAPAGLTTTEGKVDTAVILASIVAEAQLAAGEEFGQGDLSEPSEAVAGGTSSMIAATEDVLYLVAPGDSLGALALRFYGDADLGAAIFKANRQVMDTPESLAVGMKLLIPAKSGL